MSMVSERGAVRGERNCSRTARVVNIGSAPLGFERVICFARSSVRPIPTTFRFIAELMSSAAKARGTLTSTVAKRVAIRNPRRQSERFFE
jgi:hypothetical protein